MTIEEALMILGMEQFSSPDEIKKKYHKLMLLTHPDMGESAEYPYDAREINVAYEYLMENIHFEEIRKEKKKKNRIPWNAPHNPNAYAARPIYHYVENSEGHIIGEATIDEGPYIWTIDEEFKLFLKSILNTAKRVISESDEKYGRNRSDDMLLLTELSYLLAQQYVDTDMVLSLLSKDKVNERIYHIDAMVEMDLKRKIPILEDGDFLYPSRISRHRLYVKDGKEDEIGYLSFHDDRLYYGIIPLFEWRAAMIKILVKNKKNTSKQSRKKYLDVDLQIKLNEHTKINALDCINLRIEKILKERK